MSPFIPETLPLKCLDWTRFIPLIGPANAAVARYDGILKAIPNPQVLLSPFTTNEAVLSSRIEGTQATLEEVLEFDAQARPKQEPNPDVREVLNYRHAMIEAVRHEQMQKPQQARTRVKRHDAGGASAGAFSGTPEGYGTADSSDASEASAEQGEFAPAKKRRRRRKPTNRDDAGGMAGGQPHNTIAPDLT